MPRQTEADAREHAAPDDPAQWAQFMHAVDHLYGLESDDPNPAPEAEASPRRRAAGKKRYIPLLAALLALMLTGTLLWVILSPAPGRTIPEGTEVSGMALGGMTRSEAIEAVQAAFSPESHDLVLMFLPDLQQRYPAGTHWATLDANALAADAMALEQGEALSLRDYLTPQWKLLDDFLHTTAAELSSRFQPLSCEWSGTLPELGEESQIDAAALPRAQITLGTSGYSMDVEQAKERIDSSLAAGCFEIDLSPLLRGLNVPPVSPETILEQLAIAPVNATLDDATKAVIPGSYGLTLHREQLEAAQPGQTLHLDAQVIAPEVTTSQVYFRDVLGFCQTPHSDNEDRNVNLALACQALNGVVLQPGEVLSYNLTLGQRTEEAGYRKAPAYSGKELVDSLGGGICQVSSTLYLCSLYAELETVERVNHGYPANYMPIGLDATVSWGSPDLKIRNSWDCPIQILAETTDEFVRVWIMGIERRDYTVRMAFSSSSDGYARSRTCKYSLETGELLSKEEAALSGYLSIDVPTAGEIGPEQFYRYGNVRPQQIGSPKEETLEAARQAKFPNTFG